MPGSVRRTTVYLEKGLYRAAKLKAALTSQSLSELVNRALREALAEDEEDLRTFRQREKEPLLTYEKLLAELKADGLP